MIVAQHDSSYHISADHGSDITDCRLRNFKREQY